jgi:hypothetical protein
VSLLSHCNVWPSESRSLKSVSRDLSANGEDEDEDDHSHGNRSVMAHVKVVDDTSVHDATQSPAFSGVARGAEKSKMRTVYVQINAQLDKVDFRCGLGLSSLRLELTLRLELGLG